ncbi:hypothetical protein PVAND_014145 [Polypedilum vanderplanki]|uniref:Aminopeptidase n=1 Tax=Polypedilum vanderplanki TaxID=319348 RepID=A0A9J6CRV2_POLVA|nr:hypothetical protein PVAND_014145 [Polypedilum vanderplanki]
MRLITRNLRLLLSLTLLGLIIEILGSPPPLEERQLDVIKTPTADLDENYRLTFDVLPSNYKIQIEPFFENEGENKQFTFNGRVEITLKAAVANVQAIVLHVNDLEIKNYGFNTVTPNIPYNSSNYNSTYDKWTITIPSSVNGGTLPTNADTRLIVEYVGYMRDDMHGFYKSYYYENGKKIWIGTTQFQPVHARRAFPCFDEPGFKATFDLTIIRPSTHSLSLGNTKINSTNSYMDGKFIDVFNTTPKMSTYLVAFMVTNYKGSLKNTNNFGVYARPEAQKTTEYAVEIGIEMLKILSDYFNINYYEVDNVEKMDMAAIPDFSAGAMENWGLLTYRETNILYNPETSSNLNQQRIAAVIVHEQTHMWYGDLVTCKYWDYTWLNEAFARYFQFMGTKMFYNNWDLEEQFVIENLQQSMQLDSTDATHPMTSPAYTKKEASDIFDNISYNKGSSILRMLSYYVGHDNFQRILRRHVSEHKHEAVVPQDFFQAIGNITNADVASFFESWTIKNGFPLVTAKLNGTKLTLRQKRFMRAEGSNNTKTELYNIPITIAADHLGFSNHTVAAIFPDTSETFEITLQNAPTNYYILNVQQTGFYRVNYEDENWNKIKSVLHSDDRDKIHVLNRAQIVDDLFNLARGGDVEYKQAIDIIRYLKNETHYIPWLAAINQGLTFLSQRVKSEDAKIFEWFVNDLMSNIYKKLTFNELEDDRRIDIYNRVNILTWLCKYGHEDCIAHAKEAFDEYLNAFKKAPRDYRQVIYCNAIRYGGDNEFNFLFERFMNEDVAAEQLNVLIGLGCSKNERNIEKLLGRLIRTDNIRPQDRATAINAVLNSNPEGVDYLYNFITKNYDDWKETLGDLATLTTVVGRFTSKAQVEKFKAFLEKEKDNLGDLHSSLSNALTTVNSNLEWDEKYMTAFIKHLNEINSASVKIFSVILSVVTLISLYLFN